jgi:hypothetical protein
MGKHNYPKTRKNKSNTDYAKSTQLLNAVGLAKVTEILTNYGMYKASIKFNEITGEEYTPYQVRHLRSKLGLRFKNSKGVSGKEPFIRKVS